MPSGCSVGFDLGGTKMYAVVFDKNFKVLGDARVPTEGHRGVEAGSRRIRETIDDALQDAGVKAVDLEGIGIGCPGVVNFASGTLLVAPNLGWKNLEIGQFLKDIYGCPVAVLNDVDAGTFGEYCRGAAKNARSVLGAFPGTGVGGGFVYEGKILRGKNVSCMELGNIRLLGSTLEGDKGEPVSLEALASRLRISAACTIEAYRGRAPYLMEKYGTDIRNIKSGSIRKSIQEGDEAVEKIMKRAVDYLGLGVSAAVDLLAPDMVVIGGGLAEKMPDLYLKGLRKSLAINASPDLVDEVEICIAELGDLASVIGAAAYASEHGV